MNINQIADDETMLFPSTQVQADEGMEKKVSGRRRRRRRRTKKEEGEERKKRRLSDDQAKFLERSFRNERKLEAGRKVFLASQAGLDPKQVAVWFQNRRTRWKTKKLEEEYINLKVLHETTVVGNCQLQAEVLKLKEQLSDAHKEIKALSDQLNLSTCGGGGGTTGEFTNSPTSSYSMNMNHKPDGNQLDPSVEEPIFMDDYNIYSNIFDLMNFYVL